jgi:hypothetical protein
MINFKRFISVRGNVTLLQVLPAYRERMAMTLWLFKDVDA